MKIVKNKKIKFIATVDENKMQDLNKIATELTNDGIQVENVSELFGIINGKSQSSVEELNAKYKSKGISIEPNRDIKI